MANGSIKTKDAYLVEALRLFSERGYEAVGVAEIAKAVGVTTTALYKHYAGKQALFDAIVEKSEREFSETLSRLHIDFDKHPESKFKLLSMSEKDQIDMLLGLFNSVAGSEFNVYFRKLVTVEQFNQPELAEKYYQRFIDGNISAFESLMQVWIDGKIINKGNPRVLAYQYLSPVLLLVEICDRNPERKGEALDLIERHVRQFNKENKVETETKGGLFNGVIRGQRFR